MTGNVLSGDNLLYRFKELLETSRSVDIATAWATPGRHLQALRDAVERGDVKVRAIVGISGNATHPPQRAVRRSRSVCGRLDGG